MSAIGITVIEDGKIADEHYSLVNPESQFDSFNTRLTGISGKTVRNAPVFPEVWKQIEPMMSDGLLVAHNAVFDMSVLKRCLQDYNISWISFAIIMELILIIIRHQVTATPALKSCCDI